MKEINLNGLWDVRSAEGNFAFDQVVPGSVFQTLEEKGLYDDKDVFYQENNRRCLEIANRDFIFTRPFLSDKTITQCDRIYLEADGLDTITEIFLNGQQVGRTDNMHRPWIIPIKEWLKEGENTLEIRFKNSLEYIKKERKRRTLFAADNGGETSVPGFNMIRKSHCSFGWDWGPMIPDLGIWRDIRIRGYNNYRLDRIKVMQHHREKLVELEINPEGEIWGKTPFIELILTGPEGEIGRESVRCGQDFRFTIKNPQLWWPNGLGEQPLYKLEGHLPDGQHREMNLGLRTLTVRQEKDQWGESFTFTVNNIPFFSRGADYIPEDVYLTRVNTEKKERLIKDAIEANFNTLRVWGGGVYPSEDFYDLCDKYGLVVWQDLMFACAVYDVKNEPFLKNMTGEVRENLKRICHHPSIGLICGNNEMEEGILNWYDSSLEERGEYLKQYESIFLALVKEICPQIFYWPSSPSSQGNFEEPNSPDRGDCHFWEVWHGLKPFSEYTKHYFRFMSEFGFESYPDIKTIKSFTTEEDRNPFSSVMDDHQRCPGGNSKIFYYMSQYFKAPNNLKNTVYLSQISQADALSHGICHWRRHRGRCMGAVYWQLNDNWPSASWSSIDYYGRWKALHYQVKRDFAPLLLSCEEKEETLSLWLSNEDREEKKGILRWQLTDFSGQIIKEESRKALIPPFTSQAFITEDVSKVIKEEDRKNRILFARFEEEKGAVYQRALPFCAYKHAALEDPELTLLAEDSPHGLVIRIKAIKPALFVTLELSEGEGVFSDNFFPMRGGEERKLTLRGESSLNKLRKQLRIMSLWDSFY
jgi:beta-mannosidase